MFVTPIVPIYIHFFCQLSGELFATFVILLAANLNGFYHNTLYELSARRTFLTIRDSAKASILLNSQYEKIVSTQAPLVPMGAIYPPWVQSIPHGYNLSPMGTNSPMGIISFIGTLYPMGIISLYGYHLSHGYHFLYGYHLSHGYHFPLWVSFIPWVSFPSMGTLYPMGIISLYGYHLSHGYHFLYGYHLSHGYD